ncbi:hypothetical protein SAMN04487857_10238 [Pseudomonas sp. ok272]|uniref:aminoglycoside phosphotransferase family protein n=1 Tax=unclassified Pseudomonas TaxID=196821 RepID=UPI0008D6A685|nr:MULTISPECIES: phosphotransferase [unclassified Pseudomonas]SEM44670.1 hypothetical protein SAMN04487857_10238 [Pseudomonas sp. ok272]SFM16518.1 hypothetical protein SAMN04487858_10139 [Pseudomonas sp. ok602]
MSNARAQLMTQDLDRTRVRAEFLARAGYPDALLEALPADASSRRYFRLAGAGLLLMDSPPASEPIGPYVQVAGYLQSLGLSAPALRAVDEDAGLALIEDFGHGTYTRLLAAGVEEWALYRLAVDALALLHNAAPIDTPAFSPYDAARLGDEYALFIDWYVPLLIGEEQARVLREPFMQVFAEACADVAQRRETLVLRDYHVDNLMRLDDRDGVSACGLLDFQDALVGAAAYDLMSLLEDARRDVPPTLRVALLAHYTAQRGGLDAPRFMADYQVLAAQRHAKVLGIFVRLALRDGKQGYLAHLPRVLDLFICALEGPALEPLRDFLDRHVAGWRDGIPPAALVRFA